MIQLTAKQFQELKNLVKESEPSSHYIPHNNGPDELACCGGNFQKYEHVKGCPKTAWNKLDLFLTTLEPE